MGGKKGFSLIEVLIVVLIVGILAAVVLPWLQRAIIRTRYSAMLLTAKSIWEGQEAYYLFNNQYAADPADLDLTVPTSNNITLTVQGSGDYAYVRASRTNFNAHFVLYQKNSRYFAGQTHCEALEDDTNANWVCEEGFHGTAIEDGPRAGYNTYVLSRE